MTDNKVMGNPVEFPKATLARMEFRWCFGTSAMTVIPYPTRIPAVQTHKGHTNNIHTSLKLFVTLGHGSGDQSWLQYRILVKNNKGIVTCWLINASVLLPFPTTKPRWWRYTPTPANVQAVPTDLIEAMNVAATVLQNGNADGNVNVVVSLIVLVILYLQWYL